MTTIVEQPPCDTGVCPPLSAPPAALVVEKQPQRVVVLPAKALENSSNEDNTDHTESSRSASMSSVLSQVLEPVLLKDPLLSNIPFLYKIMLREINCSFGTVTKANDKESLQTVVQQQASMHSTDVTVLFAIRYPACPSCREHGKQLAELASKDRKVSLIGAVKGGSTKFVQETLLEFHQEIFNGNHIYQDDKWQVGKAMGGRKLSIMNMIRNAMKAQKRWKKYKVMPQGLPKFNDSDKLGQGGVLIFDKYGALRFALQENFGVEVDMEMVAAAIKETRRLGRRRSIQSN
eukprot:CAMPEP_0168772340 /NCGR_PEP_ID=MMETSP0725-20121227/3907_1 /TAXON_ID=265536 /ORGANISM="Amphiprora sp., Strain CCMP467" /LENGTH=289 /DNA_ID=CAMNT_0008821857 /DNA_START=55 /DNA_END=924 /DNA_ORIENTATION=+